MKKIFLSCLAMALAFHIVWVNGGETAGSEKKIKLGLAHVFTTDHPVHKGALRANELLQERTNGRIELQIHPAGSYAGYKDAIRAVRMGALDLCPLDTAIDFYPASGVMLGPYTFKDYDHWRKFKRSAVYKEFLDAVSEKVGVRQLSMYMFGFRHATTKNLAAKSPDDFKNFKLRVVDFPPYPEAATVLGAVGTPLPIGDVYMALSTGVADGQENPFTQILTMKFYEVQKYLILTGHMMAASGLIMSNKAWNSLSPQDQKIVSEVLPIAADYVDDLVISQEQKLLEDLKSKGMTVIQVDKQPFIDRVPAILKKYPEWVELYTKIQAVR